MVMGNLTPALVSKAEPITVQLTDNGEGQVPVIGTEAVGPVARKVCMALTVVVEPLQVSVKVKSIVYWSPLVRSAASTVSVKPTQSAVAVALLMMFARAGIANTKSRPSTNPQTFGCFLFMVAPPNFAEKNPL